MSRSGRRVAMGAVTIIVLVVTGCASPQESVEEYWLSKLESGDEATQKLAAERLAEMRSLRAVAPLIAHLPEPPPIPPTSRSFEFGYAAVEEREDAAYWETNWPGQALVKIGAASVEPVFRAFLQAGRMGVGRSGQWTGCRSTLLAFGESAVPFLEEAALSADDVTRAEAILLLRRIRRESYPSREVKTRIQSVFDGGNRVLLEPPTGVEVLVGDQLTISGNDRFLAVVQVTRISPAGLVARVLWLMKGAAIVPGDEAFGINEWVGGIRE